MQDASTMKKADPNTGQVETIGTLTHRAQHEQICSTMEKSDGDRLSLMVADRSSEKSSSDHSSQLVADQTSSHMTPMYRIRHGFNTYLQGQDSLIQKMMDDIRTNERDWEQKEGEASCLKLQLVEAQKKETHLQTRLDQKKVKIKQLKENLYQQKMLFKQEKSELEEQLRQIQDELDREKKDKDDLKQQLHQANQHIETLEKKLNQHERKEREKYQEMVKCFQRQKEILKTYRTILIFLLVILASLIWEYCTNVHPAAL